MKTLSLNRRARYDYDITRRLVAGLSLTGAEVKSVKLGHVSLRGSFIHLHNNEAFLVNAHINPYKFAATQDYDPTRSRKLLLHRRELDELSNAVATGGVSAVPLAIGLEHGLVKLEVGVGHGKKRYDKRETIKRRELAREAKRAIKRTK